MPRISIIAAVANNAVIGNANALCWHLPDDARFFRQTTLNHSVIMGRITFNAIFATLGKALPKRHNIILTHNKNNKNKYPSSCQLASSVAQALQLARQAAPDMDEIMIIGGSQIYTAFMPLAQCLYLTRVHTEIAGDSVFPDYDQTYDKHIWQQQQCISHAADERHAYAFDIVTLVRK